MKYKSYIWILTFIVLSCTAYAYTDCERSVNCSLYSQFTIAGMPTEITKANLTITKDATKIIEDEMQNKGNGSFIYILKLNESGEYRATTSYYNNSIFIGISEETIGIARDDEMILAVIIGIIFMSAIFILFGRSTMQKADKELDKSKATEYKIFGILLYDTVFLILWVGLGILNVSAVGESYTSVLNTLFVSYTIIFGIVSFIIFLCCSLVLTFLMLLKAVNAFRGIVDG